MRAHGPGIVCLWLVLAGSVLAAAGARASAESRPRLRRFALVIGSNDGGADRVELRYAGTDARAMARVVRELGGVDERDIALLFEPSREQLATAFRDLGRRLDRAAGARRELLVYYSGHSDEEGLLLSGSRLSYAELRQHIDSVPADVRIAILDSCSSGAFTRRKGGTRQPPFLIDEASHVRGHAFLSSSSASEAAQESDRLGASFFTHFLISGLRGGADVNRDGLVTLNEAYQFAFSETVARTQVTRHGVQHPAYDMHLIGTGDIVMTDLRATSAALVLGADLAGRVFIHDESGRRVVELGKLAGREIVLGLGPQRYRVVLQAGNRVFEAMVALRRGSRTELAARHFSVLPREATVARGNAALRVVPFRVTLFPPLAVPWTGDRSTHWFSLNLLVGTAARLQGIELGGLANVDKDAAAGVQIAGLLNLVDGPVIGMQVAGLGNAARELAGAQLAGAFNVARRRVWGMQLAGAVNIATDRMMGMQGAPVNLAEEIHGVQLGVVNVARRVRGVQVGVVNIADDHDGAPVGLINVIGNGRRAMELWSSDVAPIHIGFKLGSRRVYTLLTAAADREYFMTGAGIGLHAMRHGYYIDIDVAAHSVHRYDLGQADNDLLAQLRVMVGARVAGDLSLFAGGSLSATFAFDGKPGSDHSVIPSKRYESGDLVLRLHPGLFAGIAF